MKRFGILLAVFLLNLTSSASGADFICAVEDDGDFFDLIQDSVSAKIMELPQEKRPGVWRIQKCNAIESRQFFKQKEKDLILITENFLPGSQDLAVSAILFAVPLSNPITDIPLKTARRALDSQLVRWNDNGRKTVAIVYRKQEKTVRAEPMKTEHKEISYQPPQMPWTVGDQQKKEKKILPKTVYTTDDAATLILASQEPDSLAILPGSMLFSKEMKILSLNGTAPEVKNFLSGAYPLAKRYYVYSSSHRKPEVVNSISQYLLSKKFATDMVQIGLIPLTGKTPEKLH